jgi:hypothetical protein
MAKIRHRLPLRRVVPHGSEERNRSRLEENSQAWLDARRLRRFISACEALLRRAEGLCRRAAGRRVGLHGGGSTALWTAKDNSQDLRGLAIRVRCRESSPGSPPDN